MSGRWRHDVRSRRATIAASPSGDRVTLRCLISLPFPKGEDMSRQRILVIDDSPTILKLARLVLGEAEYRVATAGRAEEGLEAARAERPHLILVDALLPDMEGEAVCAALRADETCAGVPVVLMGDPAGADPASRGPRSNVVQTISKPFSPDALLSVVSQALGKTPTPGAEGGAPRPKQTDDAAGGAALAGNLSVIALADVLMLLERERQSGTLTVISGDTRLLLCLREGRLDLATAEGVTEEFLLGRFLVRSGVMDTPTLLGGLDARRASRAEGEPLPLLGRFLIDRGLIQPEDLTRALAVQTAALLFESLRWQEGRFAFERSDDLPASAREAALALGVPALLLEGFRRVDEWRLIQREIGDLERVFVRSEDRVEEMGRGRLTSDEMVVLDLTDGRRTVRQIVDASSLGAWGAMRMLYRLLEAGLIRARVPPVALPEL
jgi:DNA-binding response OmpR family regulator